ncbi:SpoIIE family protein phosphatase [Deefgea salmonis]|uniref:SpoIIE family protein phosphatase n=1 Tax=Deefgea salmonis TaxID=2875502 RepID=A0ABS8BLT8_9NEIS|nr:SpoIIE family protein phosphatase [Deefgea salmonis]MCB5196695.1 SpoIIE family protein phosphatase [Deefgea salmonis]
MEMTQPTTRPYQHAHIGRPCFGETVTGDGYVVIDLEDSLLIGIIDVLGHGEEAHELARFCESWLKTHASSDILGLMHELHLQLKGSRGTAMTLAHLKPPLLRTVGIGNTILYRMKDQPKGVAAQSGILGQIMPTLRIVETPLIAGDLIFLVTDGISEHLDNLRLMSWFSLPLNRFCVEILREYGKEHDDATCLAVRYLP